MASPESACDKRTDASQGEERIATSRLKSALPILNTCSEGVINLNCFVSRGFNRDARSTDSERALAPEAPIEILTNTHP
jgi:hypothetical protein